MLCAYIQKGVTAMEVQEGISVPVVGKSFSGITWLKHISVGRKLTLSSFAEEILTGSPYNNDHRLEENRKYLLGFLGEQELPRNSPLETDFFKKVIRGRYGESALTTLRAEHLLLLAEKISCRDLQRWNVKCIAVPHTPIQDTEGGEVILCLYSYAGHIVVDARLVHPFDSWKNCLFAFVQGAS
jgi:hypothetical protein